MPWGLRHYQQTRNLHFITFSCYRRAPLLASPQACRIFEQTLERVRCWYGLFVTGYVLMPEHVHLLLSEPQRSHLSVALQMLKQITSHQLKIPRTAFFWQARYYDFNVWSERKRAEKLDYMHMNPVKRGLVTSPEQWPWSSFRHHANGVEGVVEIESHWTARKRERLGLTPQIVRRELPHPVAKGATRVGHPGSEVALKGRATRRPLVYLLRLFIEPPAQDQQSLGAKNHDANRSSMGKVRPNRSNQSGDTECHGHEKPEGRPRAGSQPQILVTA